MKQARLAKSGGILAIVALSVVTICPERAQASGLPFATEYTQLLNYVQLAMQVEKQVTMVANQITQIQHMVKEGLPLNGQIFGVISSDMASLQQSVSTGQSIAYTMDNLDDAFNARFPGYAPTTDFGNDYANWAKTSQQSTLGALKAAGVQNSQFANEEALLQTLKSQSTSSVGIMQALQVGGEIAENQSEQLMKLRQLMMADIQSKAAYQSSMVEAQATQQANSDQFFAPVTITSDGVLF